MLVDAGLSLRETVQRMEGCYLDPAGVHAVLVSHEHIDHIRSAGSFARKFKVPVLASHQVQRKMEIEQFVWKEISAASLGTELELNFATKSEIPRWLSVVLFNSRTKEVLFSRLLTAQRAAYDGDHPYTGKFTAGDFGSAFCWYYPGFNKVRIQFIAEGEKRLQKVLAGFAGEYDQAVKEAASYNMILPVSSQPGIHMLSL
ncbi:MAG TPA: MBL fold metallo-hydrolase, partial [Syntrophomonas sp.]|nr:MBL fold metallo-hydrolase [Syntrophomonas sp.]